MAGKSTKKQTEVKPVKIRTTYTVACEKRKVFTDLDKAEKHRAENGGTIYTTYVINAGKNADKSRRRFTFASLDKAEAKVDELKREREHEAMQAKQDRDRFGSLTEKLTKAQRDDVGEAMDLLYDEVEKKQRTTLADAARAWLRLNPKVATPTLGEIWPMFMEFKKSEDGTPHGPISISYEGQLTYDLKPFVDHFSGRTVASITPDEVRGWIERHFTRRADRHTRRRLISTFFTYCMQHDERWITKNPVSEFRYAKPKKRRGAPKTLTVAQAEKLLRVAEKTKPEMVPYFAIGLFAGVRPDERKRLPWSDVNLKVGKIFITPETAKKDRPREITIQPNLAAWLEPFAVTKPTNKNGGIFWTRHWFDKIRKDALGDYFPKDVVRHTFGTMHHAAFSMKGETMRLMGHQAEQTFDTHYDGAISRDDALPYWDIMPTKHEGVIPYPKTA